MTTSIPSTMRALALDKYSTPSSYNISSSFPTPKVTSPTSVLIRCHATSINPIDVKVASGALKMLQSKTFPLQVGYDVAGTVAAIGSSVTKFKVGDEVYSRIPTDGSVADYCLSTEQATAFKPSSLTWSESACIPLAALTAYQSLKIASERLGGLEGKRVLVPGGLSGTGSFAVQLAKNVFGAEVVTTLSTGKISKFRELMGEGYEIVDYTKENVAQKVGAGTVDYLFDTMATTYSLMGCVKKGGLILSISTIPSGSAMEHMGPVPFYMKWILDFADGAFKLMAWKAGVGYDYVFMHPDGEDLTELAKYVKEGKVKPIVGRTAKLSDLQGVRDGCQQVYDAKGGIGKFVIEID